MVQSPQITSNSGATALSPSAGKSMRKQTGDGETFASLLDTNSGSVTAASPDSATSAGGVAQSATVPPRERAPSDFQPLAKPAPHAGAVKSGLDVATSKRADGASDAVRTQSPIDEHASSPASDLVFFSRAFLPTGNPGTAPVRRSSQSATDAASSETMIDAKNANQSGSENFTEIHNVCSPNKHGSKWWRRCARGADPKLTGDQCRDGASAGRNGNFDRKPYQRQPCYRARCHPDECECCKRCRAGGRRQLRCRRRCCIQGNGRPGRNAEGRGFAPRRSESRRWRPEPGCWRSEPSCWRSEPRRWRTGASWGAGQAGVNRLSPRCKRHSPARKYRAFEVNS